MATTVQERGGLSLGYILHRADQAEKRDAKRNTHWNRVEQLRHRLHEVPVPEPYKKTTRVIKVPMVDDTLRIVTTSITDAFPTVSRPPSSTRPRAQETSSLVEKWCNAALAKMDAVDGLHRAWVDEIDQAAMFGMACPKWLWRPDVWDFSQYDYRDIPDETVKRKRGETDEAYEKRARRKETDAEYNERIGEYRERAPFPFIWLTPDPRTFHAFYEHRELVEVVEISIRDRYELAERYADKGVYLDSDTNVLKNMRFSDPVAESAAGTSLGLDSVKFIEHWLLRRKKGRIETWCTYIADNTILDQRQTDYPRLPHSPYFGLSTSSRAPEYEASGIADNILDLIEAWDMALTMWLNAGYISAFPMGVVKTQAGTNLTRVDDEGNAVSTMEWRPGEFQVANPGEEWGWIVSPGIGGDIKALADVLAGLADRASGVPDILRGEAQRQETAWGQASKLMVATRRILAPISGNATISLTSRLEWLLEVLEKLHGEDVYLLGDVKSAGRGQRGWLGLGKKQIDGYYAVNVDVAVLTADRRIQEGAFGQQLMKDRVISMQTMRQGYAGIDHPEEEDEQVRIEQFRDSDQYMQRLWVEFQRRRDKKNALAAQQAGIPPEMLQQPQPQPMLPPGQPQPGMPQTGPMPGGVESIAGAPPVTPPFPGQGLPIAPPMQPPMVTEG